MTASADAGPVHVDHDALRDFVAAVLEALDIHGDHAALTADALVAADLYGIDYALQAVTHDMIGLSMTNATSLVAPTFGGRPMFGTNPIAFAAPAGDERPFLFDAATSTVSFGKIQLALADGTSIPEGWSIDGEGHATDDPVAAAGGAMLPLGSSREQGSHKGYGLALMVDVLCGVLPARPTDPTASA